MRFRPLFVLLVLATCALVARADDKPAIRDINLKGVKVKGRANFGVMETINSTDELSMSGCISDEASRDVVNKQIDFRKEKLVVWVLTVPSDTKMLAEFDKEKGLVVLLIRVDGVKKDLVEKRLVVAIPKNATTRDVVR